MEEPVPSKDSSQTTGEHKRFTISKEKFELVIYSENQVVFDINIDFA